jgi:hypothetical protein
MIILPTKEHGAVADAINSGGFPIPFQFNPNTPIAKNEDLF